MRGVLSLFASLAAALLPLVNTLAQGTIVYHQPAQPLSGLVGLQLDLDGNGQADISFYDTSYIPASYYATAASGAGTARLLVVPNLGEGSYLAALAPNFLIGGPLDESLLWAAQDAPNSHGSATVLGSYFPEDISGSLVPVGHFYGTTALMGIQFQTGSEWHYGWIRIRGGTAGPSDDGQQFYLNPPGWILDWAYETRPNTPIFAGAVPEPSTWALVAMGSFAIWFFRRR